MEPPRTLANRVLLIASIPALIVFALLFRLSAPAWMAACWLVVLVASASQARRRADALTVVRHAPEAAFEDDEVEVKLEVENLGKRTVDIFEVSDHFGASLAGLQHAVLTRPLPPGAILQLRYGATCSRHWGVYAAGPLGVAAPDALGLFLARRTLPGTTPVELFPRVHDVHGLARTGARATLVPQPWTAGRPGQGEVYLGVREYRSGDDPRSVHWRASARLGRLVVKEREVDLVPYLTLFLDLQGEHRAGLGRQSTVERLVRIGASALATASRDGWFVQLFAQGKEPVRVPPGRGETHLAVALDALIRVRQDGDVVLGEVVSRHLGEVPRGSTVVLLYSTATPDLVELKTAVEGVEKRGAVAAVVLVDHRSFRAIRRRVETAEELRAARGEVTAWLRSHGLAWTVVDQDDDVEDRLARGLFES